MLIVEFLVTEKCNLECTYCYMENKQKFMNIESVDIFLNSVQTILDLYNEKSYHISFFGGEPLLNWNIVKEATKKFKSDERCASIVIITNGLEINEEKIKFLKENNIGVSLSFDGIWNNENRPYYKNNISSFNKYLEKKQLIKELSGGSCKVMVSPYNISTMTENFEFFVNEYGFSFPDFSLVRDDIWTDDDVENFNKEIKRLADKVILLNKSNINCNVGFFILYTLDMLYGKKIGKRKFGCFAGVNGVCFTSDNKYFPCARFASQEEYLLYDANTRTFNIENINFLKRPEITNTHEFLECKECELYNVCNAGCTYSQMKNGLNENRSKPIENLCKIMKMCYRESFRVYEELKETPQYVGYLKHRIKNVN